MPNTNIRKNSSNDAAGACKSFAVAGAVSVLFSAFVIIILALVAYSRENPGAFVRPLSYLALAISALGCGIINAKVRKKASLISGLIGGFIFVIVMFICSLFFGDSSISSVTGIIIYICFILVAGIGGIIGGAKRIKGKRRHR